MPLPHHLQSQLDRELDAGETVVWVAQPLPHALRLNAIGNWAAMAFVVGFIASMFAIVGWTAAITPPSERESDPAGFFIFSAVLVMLWLVSLPLFLAYARSTARSTVYAITDRRAIVLHVGRRGRVNERDYRGDELVHLARDERPDGSGTITFESARGSARKSSAHRFLAIPDALGVERLLRERFGNA